MSHTTTGGRRGIAVGAVVFAAVIATTTACGSQTGADIKDTGSAYSVPRHGGVHQHPATSADAAERRGAPSKKFTPPPAGMRVPD